MVSRRRRRPSSTGTEATAIDTVAACTDPQLSFVTTYGQMAGTSPTPRPMGV